LVIFLESLFAYTNDVIKQLQFDLCLSSWRFVRLSQSFEM